MEIISHRGYWTTPEEKNTPAAFIRSFQQGFGTETDIRDLNGHLVISHDCPVEGAMTFAAFGALYKQHGDGLPLALNIKSDGLQDLLAAAVAEIGISNFFVFDMSVPDAIKYMRSPLPAYTRQSEYEADPSLYEEADGVWMDIFLSEWVRPTHIFGHLDAGKQVCLVSPDLHRRPHQDYWTIMKDSGLSSAAGLTLCTDHPVEARTFFHG